MLNVQLPVQKLVRASIDQNKLHKFFFQFEIIESVQGIKRLLGAYPAFLPGWQTKRVELPVIDAELTVQINLPLTFGNLEINKPIIQQMNNSKKNEFIMRPILYTQNPHAMYQMFDGTTSITKANPSPPAQLS